MDGYSFNPMIALALKAYSFFDDLSALPIDVRKCLSVVVDSVKSATLSKLTPYARRINENGDAPSML
jgi:hypothetical protein